MAKKKKKKRAYKNTKALQMPEKYKAGFLQGLDGRTIVYETLNSAYQEVIADLGGIASLSHAKVCLVERFVFLEFVLRGLEQKIATKPKQSATLLGRWIQGLNSLQGLAKTIGLERNPKKIMSLEKYIGDNDE